MTISLSSQCSIYFRLQLQINLGVTSIKNRPWGIFSTSLFKFHGSPVYRSVLIQPCQFFEKKTQHSSSCSIILEFEFCHHISICLIASFECAATTGTESATIASHQCLISCCNVPQSFLDRSPLHHDCCFLIQTYANSGQKSRSVVQIDYYCLNGIFGWYITI